MNQKKKDKRNCTIKKKEPIKYFIKANHKKSKSRKDQKFKRNKINKSEIRRFVNKIDHTPIMNKIG